MNKHCTFAALLAAVSISCADIAPVEDRRSTAQSLRDDDVPPRDPDGGAPVIGVAPRDGRPATLIISMSDATTDAQLDDAVALARRLGAVQRVYRQLFKGFAATLSASAIASIRAWSNVQYLEYSTRVRSTLARGLDRIDQRRTPLDQRFTVLDRAPGVNVYVVDSGVRLTHVEFEGRARSIFSGVECGGEPDCTGHGTGVASVIAGAESGVARGANIFSARVIAADTFGDSEVVVDALNEIRRQLARPAVVNLSFIGGASRSINRAVRRLVDAGAVVVAGAGNGDPVTGFDLGVDACPFSPASEPAAITVANADPLNDFRSGTSNFGPCVDIFAPGVDIAMAGSATDSSPQTRSGTSFAAPHVAGVAALLLAANPDATPAQITAQILDNATRDVVRDAGQGSPNKMLYAFAPTFSGDRGWFVGDFNGDGRDDLLRFVTGACGADVLLSTGSSFVRAGCWTGFGVSSVGWKIADYDGDGRDDLVRSSGTVDGSSTIEVLRSTGVAFAAPVQWSLMSSGDAGFSVGRFNSDARADLLRTREGVSGADVLRSSGTTFVYQPGWTLAGDGDRGWIVGDYNGDGRDDLLRYRAGISGGEVFTSTGTSFVGAGSWTLASDGDDGWYVGDFNGDGRSDLSRYRAGISGAEVFLSTGSAFAGAGSWTLAGHSAEKFRVGDFDGDGRSDLLRTIANSVGAQPLLSNGSNQFVLQHDWSAGASQ
ncbi:MAG: S8 family serine peptidase [Myxococcales bacterium]|nr:S8 family serine peptidase [Myxococcales bacterium]